MFSGGSGGGYIPISKPDQFDCKDLVIVTSLNSPVAEVIENINVGDILEIARNGEIVLAKYKRRTAGSITHVLYTELLDCMKKGNKYLAKVLKKKSGNCEVKITHKTRI